MQDSMEDRLPQGRLKHNARSLVALANEALMSRLGDPAVMDLVSYVGVNEFTPAAIELLMDYGYHPFDLKSKRYTDAKTKAFARTDHKRDDGTIDLLVENSNNILGLDLNEGGVMPLYYMNYLKIDRGELNRYLDSVGLLLCGERRSRGDFARKSAVPLALLAGSMGLMRYDQPELSLAAASVSLASFFGILVLDAARRFMAVNRLSMDHRITGRYTGIPSLIVALDGKIQDSRSEKYH